MADEEGKAAAQNILEGNMRQVDYSVVPSTVFAIPSIASVGLAEDQAREMQRDFRVNRGTTIAWPSSKRIGEEYSGYKILVDNQSDEIIGGHLVLMAGGHARQIDEIVDIHTETVRITIELHVNCAPGNRRT